MRRIRTPVIEAPVKAWSPIDIATRAGLPLSPGIEAILRAFDGQSLNQIQLKAFRELTNTTFAKPRQGGYSELWVNAGRRSGKTTRLGAVIAVSAAMQPVDHLLAPGELARVLVICPTLSHGRQAFDAIKGILGVLRVEYRERDREILLTGRRTTILAIVADHVAPRGGTAVAAIIDEAALLPTQEGSDGFDQEIFAAVKPALATTRGKLVVISTPWMRKGVHFDTCEKFRGKTESNKLVIHATTWQLNPSLTEALCREAESDPRRFKREYAAIAGDTDESFLKRSDILACVDTGVEFRPPSSDNVYVIGLDIGLRRDRTALVVAHREYKARLNASPIDLIVVDAIKTWTPRPGEKLPFDAIMEQVASIAKQYNNARIVRDFWGGDSVESALRQHGATSTEVSMSPAQQHQRFSLLAQGLQTGRIRLVDCPLAIEELSDLRVKLHAAGRTEVAAPDRRGAHDDVADALALAVEVANTLPPGGDIRCDVSVSYSMGAGMDLHVTKRWYRRVIDSTGEHWLPSLPPPGTQDWYDAQKERYEKGEYDPTDFDENGKLKPLHQDPLDGNPFSLNIPIKY